MKYFPIALAALTTLTGCGGGSSTSAPSTPVTVPTYTVGGTISGLSGTVVLKNGSDVLAVNSNGAFTLPTSAHAGDSYSVTVNTQPSTPTQTCTVGNGAGSFVNANVTSVTVSCVSIPLTLKSSAPADGAINVARDGVISLTFSMNLQAAVPASAISLSDASGAKTITTSISANTLTITPSQKLSKVTDFTVTVSTTLSGSGGEQLANPVTVKFKSADGAWTAPTLIEAYDGGDAFEARVAVDASGKGVAIWRQQTGSRTDIAANHFDPATGWDNPTLVEQNDLGSAFSPAFSFDANGNGLAVWTQSTGGSQGVWSSRYYGNGGTWGTPVQLESTVGTSDSTSPRVAFDPFGNAFAIWARKNALTESFSSATGWTGTTLPLGDIFSGDSAWMPQLCFDGQGRALAVWERIKLGAPNGTTDAFGNLFVPGIGWGIGKSIDGMSPSSESETLPKIACESDGSAFAIWAQTNGAQKRVVASRYSPQTGWSAAESIGSGTTAARGMAIAVDTHGNAIAAWSQADATRKRVWVNRYTAGSGWGTAIALDTNAAGAGAAEDPEIAIAENGNVTVIWEQVFGTAGRIVAARYIVGSGWTAPSILDPNDSGATLYPRIAVDSSDNAIAVWHKFDGTRYNIWSSRFE